jgi:hypothetical protein
MGGAVEFFSKIPRVVSISLRNCKKMLITVTEGSHVIFIYFNQIARDVMKNSSQQLIYKAEQFMLETANLL